MTDMVFNLIVSLNGWPPGRGSIKRSRVFEYTDETLEKRFGPDNILDIEMLRKLPTVFAPETGSQNQVARVGTITRIHESGTDLQLEYTFDNTVSPISNATLTKLASEFNIERLEMRRTHWAIKEVDLFKILFYKTRSALLPKVFNLSYEGVDDSLVSLMMPFDSAFNDVHSSIVGAVQKTGKRCQRADDIWKHDAVIQDIVFLICISSVVICDLSRKNANVFYEAGIAHALGKDVILIAQSQEDIPFDLRHLRHIQYLNNQEGRAALAERLRDRILVLDSERLND